MITQKARILLIGTVTLILAPSLLAGQIPDPECNTVSPILTISPDGSAVYSVRLRTTANCSDPVPGITVCIEFSPEADALIAWGEGQEHPIVCGITDANGEVEFRIRGAGCVTAADPSLWVVRVRTADGIILQEPIVNSPDAVNSAGMLPAQIGGPICEDGVTYVSLADAVFHTRPVGLGLVAPCSKFVGDPDEAVNLEDAVFLTPYVKLSVSADCGP